MLRHFRSAFAGALLSAFAFAAPAGAVTLTQDQSAFDSATAGLSFTLQDFDGLPFMVNLTSADFGDFAIDGTDSTFAVLPSPFCLAGSKCPTSLAESVTFTFAAPVFAMGFFLGDGHGATSDVLVDGANIGGITTPGTGFTFVGVYDLTTPFTTVRLPGDLLVFDIDNVSYAFAPAVPEPTTLALFGLGLAALARARRRRTA